MTGFAIFIIMKQHTLCINHSNLRQIKNKDIYLQLKHKITS